MARSTPYSETRLTDLETPSIDIGYDAPEHLLDRLRVQNVALDQLRHGLAVEDGRIVSSTPAFEA